MNCRVCDKETTEPFLSLPEQPPANELVKDGEPSTLYPLELVFCPSCHLVQLSSQSYIARQVLFDNYAYASSVPKALREHFIGLAKEIKSMVPSDGLVLDIGSNDGVLLKPLKELGVRAIGIEPARNLAQIANDNGLETIWGYWGMAICDLLGKSLNHPNNADVIVASNVFAHVESIQMFLAHVEHILKPSGTLILEVQYLADMIKDLSFDNIYHEHVYYFTVESMINVLSRSEFYIWKIRHVNTHGGSLRVYAKREMVAPSQKELRTIEPFIAGESDAMLDFHDTYVEFEKKVQGRLQKFRHAVRKLRQNKKIVAAYGAPAKASTLLNSAGLNVNDIAYIVDDNPLKQGLFVPKAMIPIRSSDYMKEVPPDYLVLFAWNYANEIEENLKQQGIKAELIIPMGPNNNLEEFA